jgi:ATP-dependent Lon protease
MECQYIFKKGVKKNNKCNRYNCKLHAPTSNTDGKETPVPVSEYNIHLLNTSKQNKDEIMKHVSSLKKLDSSSTEYYKNKLFIEQAISVPWNKYYSIKYDKNNLANYLKNIKKEFDNEIYGMESVKNDIMNFICKLITNPYSERNNLALHGPAGVCKTKFIKVLSKVLNMPLKIISLGGIKDSSYFLGHNFTYVESNYGCIIGSIIEKGIMNPIMYFDELDKISDTSKDIYSVLSNLTDSTINSHFTDHYFRGITFDLSKVFYIFTFNDITKIDSILLDRLNIIYINSPSKSEKCIILQKYCLPDLLKNIGIKPYVNFDENCFVVLLNYTESICNSNETSGIRESIRILEKILLQINKEILLDELKGLSRPYDVVKDDDEVTVSIEQFNKYLNRIKKNNTDDLHFGMYL